MDECPNLFTFEPSEICRLFISGREASKLAILVLKEWESAGVMSQAAVSESTGFVSSDGERFMICWESKGDTRVWHSGSSKAPTILYLRGQTTVQAGCWWDSRFDTHTSRSWALTHSRWQSLENTQTPPCLDNPIRRSLLSPATSEVWEMFWKEDSSLIKSFSGENLGLSRGAVRRGLGKPQALFAFATCREKARWHPWDTTWHFRVSGPVSWAAAGNGTPSTAREGVSRGGGEAEGGGVPTYEVRLLQDLAGREVLLFRGLVGIFLVHFIEAGRTSWELALLQKLHITLVQTIQRPPAYSPVEIVHALALKWHHPLPLEATRSLHAHLCTLSPCAARKVFPTNAQALTAGGPQTFCWQDGKSTKMHTSFT